MAHTLAQAIDDYVYPAPGLRALLLTDDDWKTMRKIADIHEVRHHHAVIALLI